MQSVALATDAAPPPMLVREGKSRRDGSRLPRELSHYARERRWLRGAADRVHMHKWPGREEGTGKRARGRTEKGTKSQSRCKNMMEKSLSKSREETGMETGADEAAFELRLYPRLLSVMLLDH